MKESFTKEEKISHLKNRYSDIISFSGEDVEREGLIKTPERAAKAMDFLTSGYNHLSLIHI